MQNSRSLKEDFDLSRQVVRNLFLSNRSCPEIITHPGNKIHSRSVPRHRSFSLDTIFREKNKSMVCLLPFALSLQAHNRPVGVTGE